jgi:hypothetical protein
MSNLAAYIDQPGMQLQPETLTNHSLLFLRSCSGVFRTAPLKDRVTYGRFSVFEEKTHARTVVK